jgi:hypothetical protein
MSKTIENVQETAKAMFTRFQHYYVRNGGHPVATIVVGIRKGTGKICRGISICSVQENFDRAEGLRRAIKRMVDAAKRHGSDEPIHTGSDRQAQGKRVGVPAQSVDRAFDTGVGVGNCCFKSVYDADLTEKERSLLVTAKQKFSKKA